MIGGSSAWRALGPTRFALLDAEFARACAVLAADHPRAVSAAPSAGHRDLGALRAISCQPKLEVRLVLLLWHLAARWGRVEPSGIRLSLPLTHRLLGQLVAAERPSISHALARLSHAGIVTGTAGDWHLHGSARRPPRGADRADRTAAPVHPRGCKLRFAARGRRGDA